MGDVISLPRPSLPVLPSKDRHSKFLNILYKMASDVAPVANARIAAAIVKNKEIISFGVNQTKSHPFQARFGKNANAIYLHAENCAIKNALRCIDVSDLARSALYVARVKYNGSDKSKFVSGLAKPCEGCSRSIATFGISKVIYSLDNEGFAML